MSTKIAKACEPCRLAKTRCSGSQPCQRRPCKEDPERCVYRSKARIRKSKSQLRASAPSTTPDILESQQSINHRSSSETTQPEVYHSVTETHLSPKSTDSSQLFYGPSSNFAFLQQVHRGVLSVGQHAQTESREGRSGLDTFMQRSIFFGTPPRIDPEAIRSSSIRLPLVSRSRAQEFLEAFKEVSYYRLPFYTSSELDGLLAKLYDDHVPHAIPPQTKATFLAILAVGALSTPHTDLAEALYTEAKREVVIFDDAVTLQMLQLSILFSDYQVNMGRPNSTYLHLGAACRKAFALGLHIEALQTRLDEVTLQKHQTTLWLLYFYETCQALTLGRRSAMKLGDIACPFPTEPPAVARLGIIAKIMEDTAESIYGKRVDSLRQLFVTAEDLHCRLRRFAQENGVASSPTGPVYESGPQDFEAITLHNLYYHAIILVFRPFMVASRAMLTNRKARDGKEMWLRQACRYAVDAAQDSIEYSSRMFAADQGRRCHRYQGYFIECSCGILLYDTLCQPSKYTYNMEYINKAMQALSSMVADEPITTVLNSISRVLGAVESSISEQIPAGDMSAARGPLSDMATPISEHHYPSIQFPSLDHLGMDRAEQMIFLTGGTNPGETTQSDSAMASASMDQDWLNPNHFNLNVMTTDLFNFFPIDMSTPVEYPPVRADGGMSNPQSR